MMMSAPPSGSVLTPTDYAKQGQTGAETKADDPTTKLLQQSKKAERNPNNINNLFCKKEKKKEKKEKYIQRDQPNNINKIK